MNQWMLVLGICNVMREGDRNSHTGCVDVHCGSHQCQAASSAGGRHPVPEPTPQAGWGTRAGAATPSSQETSTPQADDADAQLCKWKHTSQLLDKKGKEPPSQPEFSRHSDWATLDHPVAGESASLTLPIPKRPHQKHLPRHTQNGVCPCTRAPRDPSCGQSSGELQGERQGMQQLQ